MVTPGLRELRHPQKAVIAPLSRSFNAELDLITSLVQTYERHALEYAQDGLTLHLQQRRARIAWIVGAIDKVGLLPLAITAYFAYRDITAQQGWQVLQVGFFPWTWGLLAFMVTVYGGATLYTSLIQELDGLCLVLKHAVQAKKALTSADRPNGGGKPEGKPLTVLSDHNAS